MSTEKDQGNVARGLKAAIHNPRVSEEAKEHDRERLREMGEEVPDEEPSYDNHNKRRRGGSTTRSQDEDYEANDGDEKHEHRVLGGYKATLKNPNVSEGAKERAREILEDAGEL